MKIRVRKIRIFWLILLFIILAFLLYQKISPSGYWSCQRDFTHKSSLFSANSCISSPSPKERVALGSGDPIFMLADPLYFSIFTPRAFKQVNLKIVFRPHLSSSTPVIEAGFLADAKLWRYQLEPVYNLWLEKDFSSWQHLEQGKLSLYERKDNFSSIPDFLTAWRGQGSSLCTSPNCLAVYNVDTSAFPPAISLPTGENKVSDSVFPYTLRGAHQLYVYLNGNEFQVKGKLVDRNENKDKDDVEMSLYQGKAKFASFSIADKRPESEESGQESAAQSFQFNKEGLNPGLYRLDIRTSDDIEISNLDINSPELSFINRIWLSGSKAISLWTDVPLLQVKALSPLALQSITFGDKSFKIDDIYHQYELRANASSEKEIKVDSGGLIMAGQGVFSSSRDLLNPNYPHLDRFAPSLSQLDYVLASYSSPKVLADGWLEADISMPASSFYREKGNYNLMVSIPGLSLDKVSGMVEIKSIELDFSGSSLKDKLKSWF